MILHDIAHSIQMPLYLHRVSMSHGGHGAKFSSPGFLFYILAGFYSKYLNINTQFINTSISEIFSVFFILDLKSV